MQRLQSSRKRITYQNAKENNNKKTSSATISEASSNELPCRNANSKKVKKNSKHDKLKDIEEIEEKRK